MATILEIITNDESNNCSLDYIAQAVKEGPGYMVCQSGNKEGSLVFGGDYGPREIHRTFKTLSKKGYDVLQISLVVKRRE